MDLLHELMWVENLLYFLSFLLEIFPFDSFHYIGCVNCYQMRGKMMGESLNSIANNKNICYSQIVFRMLVSTIKHKILMTCSR